MAFIYTIVTKETEDSINLKNQVLVEKKEYMEDEARFLLSQTIDWEIEQHLQENHDHDDYGETTSSKITTRTIGLEDLLVDGERTIGCIVNQQALFFEFPDRKIEITPYSYDISRLHKVYVTGYYCLKYYDAGNRFWEWDAKNFTMTLYGKTENLPHYYREQIKSVLVKGVSSLSELPCLKSFSNLEFVRIDCDIAEICEDAFYDCKKLKKVQIPEAVTKIGKYAFSGCESLEEISLPRVEIIEMGAFSRCHNLHAIHGLQNLVQIEKNAFLECLHLKEFFIGKEVSFFSADFLNYCPELVSVKVSEENAKYSSRDGIVYNKEGTCMLFVPCNYPLEELVLSPNIEEIAEKTFAFCKNLKKVIFSNSVQTLGVGAFFGCHALEDLVLPLSLEVIPQKFCYDCSSLNTVLLPETLKRIEKQAFERCSSLKNIVIPKSVVDIGEGTFCFCEGLESVSIFNPNCKIGRRNFEHSKKIILKYPACANFIDTMSHYEHFRYEVFDGVRRKDYRGNVFEGKFDANLTGIGVCRFAKSSYGIRRKYKGEFVKGRMQGEGVFTLSIYGKFEWEYVGQFKDEQFHGDGMIRYKDGTVLKGEFLDGKPWNAEGTFKVNYDKALCESRESVYNGIWKEGKFYESREEKI